MLVSPTVDTEGRKLKGGIQRSTETGLAVEMPSRTVRQASHESIEDSMNSYGSEGKWVNNINTNTTWETNWIWTGLPWQQKKGLLWFWHRLGNRFERRTNLRTGHPSFCLKTTLTLLQIRLEFTLQHSVSEPVKQRRLETLVDYIQVFVWNYKSCAAKFCISQR